MARKTFISLFLVLVFSVSSAQSPPSEGHSHEEHKNDLGFGITGVHFLKEGGFAASVHIHYIKSIGEKGFGLGLEYERIFDVHRHNTIGIVGNFKASERLSFSLSPGIAFEGGSGEGPWPALHFEALYEWEFGKIHIGPVAGVAYEVEDFHLSAGIHFGFGF